MKIGFLITARLKSKRLPLKLLLKINNKTMIEHVIDRCKLVNNIDDIILCTSNNSQDLPLIEIAKKNKINFFLGDELDVLNRLSSAAKKFNLDYIINITGENPLFSIFHANKVVAQAIKEKNDFIFLEGLPIGCAVYGINPLALTTVCQIKKEIDTEIWGPLINRPEIFSVKKINVSKKLSLPNVRITSDYIEDFNFIEAIYTNLSNKNVPSYKDVLKLLKDYPELLDINKMHYQRALNPKILNRIDEFFQNNKTEILAIKQKVFLKN